MDQENLDHTLDANQPDDTPANTYWVMWSLKRGWKSLEMSDVLSITSAEEKRTKGDRLTYPKKT